MRSKWFLQMFYTWFGNRHYSKREREYSFSRQPWWGGSRVGGWVLGMGVPWVQSHCNHPRAAGATSASPKPPARGAMSRRVTPVSQQYTTLQNHTYLSLQVFHPKQEPVDRQSTWSPWARQGTRPSPAHVPDETQGLMRFAAGRAAKELTQYFICFLHRSIYYLFLTV